MTPARRLPFKPKPRRRSSRPNAVLEELKRLYAMLDERLYDLQEKIITIRDNTPKLRRP